jgi:dGTPase
MALYDRFLVRTPSASPTAEDRSEVAKDRDRLIHSSGFRRLQGKSQIVGVEVGDFFRTRITHSLECAQIGRAIATAVARTDDWESVVEDPLHLPDLVEAACLAHDLGHPPFGHNGEQALRRKMQKYAGCLFEGNPQSFRMVTFLEPKFFGPTQTGPPDEDRWVGLDLTRTTLRALTKYPILETRAMLREPYPKCGAYRDATDVAYFNWAWDGEQPTKTLAARIMDVADDIAYAVHDFEDGVWAAMIPLHDLLQGNDHVTGLLEDKTLERDRKGLFAGGEFASTIEALFQADQLDYLRRVPFDRTQAARAALKNFTARIIGELIAAVAADGRFVEPRGDVARRIAVLKAMAWQWMIERTDRETIQFGQRRLVERIFDGYWKHPEMLPRREEWNVIARSSKPRFVLSHRRVPRRMWPEKARLICDHIAGMTDGYARDVYDQMYRATQRRELHLTY